MPLSRKATQPLKPLTIVRYRVLSIVVALTLTLSQGISWAAPENRTADKAIEKLTPSPGIQLLDHTVHFGLQSTLQVDIIHDFNAIGLDYTDSVAREFITSEIPVSGSRSAQDTNRTILSPNQSNLILWASTDTKYGEAKAFVDFNLTRSPWDTQFQVYKAWAKLGYLKIGIDYSLFMNQEAIPSTLDFEGPQVLPEPTYAHVNLEFPIARIGNSKQKNISLGIGIEDSDAQVTLDPDINATTDDQIPSIIGNLTYNTNRANLKLIGVYRRLRATGDNYDSSANGWGLYLSGHLKTWGDDVVMGGILGGRGISALIDDTTGLNLDAVSISTSDSQLRAVGLLGVWGAYEHSWNEYFRSTTTFGYLKAYTNFIDRNFGPGYEEGGNTKFVGIYHETIYASANLIWNPISLFDLGVEYLYGHQQMVAGSSSFDSNDGHDHRIQVTLRINFKYVR